MSDLGKITYYLGIEVPQYDGGIVLSQERYAKKILEETGMQAYNLTHIPMEVNMKISKSPLERSIDEREYRRSIGCLRYLLHTRPDLSFSVGVLSRYMQDPKEFMAQHYSRFCGTCAGQRLLAYVSLEQQL